MIIAGCDSGFGRLIALNLNEEGLTVFAGCLSLSPASSSSSPESLSSNPESSSSSPASLKEECKFPDKMIPIPLDVTDEESVKSACERVKRSLSVNHLQLWSLINNAGIAPFHEFEWGSFSLIRSVMEVNVLGMALVTRTFLPLIRSSQGRIININSVASRFAIPQTIGYDMSKHASLAFVEGLRREMFKFGVRVISVEPFLYKTNITHPDSMRMSGERVWSETREEIRVLYGRGYLDRMLELNQTTVTSSFNRDPVEVAWTVNHAVTSFYPKMTYPVSTCFWRLLFFLIPFIHPQELVEMAVNLGTVVNGFHTTY